MSNDQSESERIKMLFNVVDWQLFCVRNKKETRNKMIKQKTICKKLPNEYLWKSEKWTKSFQKMQQGTDVSDCMETDSEPKYENNMSIYSRAAMISRLID